MDGYKNEDWQEWKQLIYFTEFLSGDGGKSYQFIRWEAIEYDEYDGMPRNGVPFLVVVAPAKFLIFSVRMIDDRSLFEIATATAGRPR